MEEMPNQNENNSNTLARIDERTKGIQNDIASLRTELHTSVETLNDSIKDTEERQKSKNQDIDKRFEILEKELDRDYVKKGELTPIRYIVYGFVGLICTAVVTAMVASVIHSSAIQIPQQITTTIPIQK